MLFRSFPNAPTSLARHRERGQKAERYLEGHPPDGPPAARQSKEAKPDEQIGLDGARRFTEASPIGSTGWNAPFAGCASPPAS